MVAAPSASNQMSGGILNRLQPERTLMKFLQGWGVTQGECFYSTVVLLYYLIYMFYQLWRKKVVRF